MKYNKIIYTMLAALCLASCDKIDEGDRLVYVEPEPINLSSVRKVVLLEDFTGQKCINCPSATNTIGKILEQYGEESVIPVAIHGGSFGVSESRGGLATDEAASYYEKWNVESQPAGVINRKGGVVDAKNWMTEVFNCVRDTTPVDIKTLTATLNATGDSIKATFAAVSAEPLSAKVQLWLLEDSIVAIQLFPGNISQKEYVHNHVFRKSINGTWGEPISLTTDSVARQFSTDISSKYNKKHLSVVAFVYTDENGVYQTAKCEVGF